MTRQPAVAPRLVGVEVVEHDVDVAIGVIGVIGDDLVHEVEELDTAPPTVVAGPDLAGRHVERGKEGGRAAASFTLTCAPPALSGGKPIFDMNSRLVEAVKRMLKSYSVEHGLPQPKRCL